MTDQELVSFKQAFTKSSSDLMESFSISRRKRRLSWEASKNEGSSRHFRVSENNIYTTSELPNYQ